MAKKLIQVIYQVTDTELLKAEKTIQANEKAANDADKAVKKYGQDAKKAGDDASKSFSNLGNVWKSLIAIGIVSFIGSLAKKTFELGVQQEQLNIAFSTFLGSAEKAKKLIADLTKFAIVTPFTPDQVNKAARALLSFGVAGKDIIPTLKMLGDVSAGTGKDLAEMAIIFGQIRSTGRLMGQDLLQLINAGFNPLQVISDKTGKSVGQLKGEMEKGLITFDMVSEAFKTATSEGGLFFNLMEKQSQSVGGLLSTVSGNIDETLKNLFTANTGIISSFTQALVKASEGLLAFSETADQALERNNSAIRNEFKTNLEGFIKTYGDAKGAVAAFDKVLNEQLDTLEAELRAIQTAAEFNAEDQKQKLLEITVKRQQLAALKEYTQGVIDEAKAKEKADLQKKLEAETKAADENAKALKKLAKERHKNAEEISRQVPKENDITEGFGVDNLINAMGFLTEDQRKALEEDTKAMLKRIDDATNESLQARLKSEQEAAERQSQIRQAVFDQGINFIQQLLTMNLMAQDETFQREKGNFDRRLATAGDNERARMEIETERAKFEEEQDRKQEAFEIERAKRDKERQIKQMIIQNLVNALRALGEPPVPNFALAGITAGFGVAQVVAAKAIGFKEGVIGLNGPGNGTSDSIPARLSKGESVITAKATERSFDLLTAINDGRIDDRILRKLSTNGGSSPTIINDNKELVKEFQGLKINRYEDGYFTMNEIQRANNFKQRIKSKYRS